MVVYRGYVRRQLMADVISLFGDGVVAMIVMTKDMDGEKNERIRRR